MIIGAVVLIGIIVPKQGTPSSPDEPRPASTTRARAVAPPPAAAAALPAGSIPGDGTFLVPTEVEPGTYRSEGAQHGGFEFCSWRTLDDAATNAGTLDFGTANADEPMIVKIDPDVKAFDTSNCEPWTKIS